MSRTLWELAVGSFAGGGRQAECEVEAKTGANLGRSHALVNTRFCHYRPEAFLRSLSHCLQGLFDLHGM